LPQPHCLLYRHLWEANTICQALSDTQLPDLTIDLATVREQLTFQRTEPVPGVSEREISVTNSSKTANLRCLVYWPAENKEAVPVYVLFHPGGWYVGDPEVEERNCRIIAKEHNVVVFAPTYRLAPENPFPAGVNDVWDWTQWIARHASDLGINADPTKGYILAGESPGGNMALVSALRARDTPAELKGVSVTGVHCRCSQLCAPDAIPEEYKKYFTSYEQCRDAPVFNRGVQECTEGQ
jgi:acetyl esterase/lipase